MRNSTTKVQTLEGSKRSRQHHVTCPQLPNLPSPSTSSGDSEITPACGFDYLEKGRRESAESAMMKIQSSPLMWWRRWECCYQFLWRKQVWLGSQLCTLCSCWSSHWDCEKAQGHDKAQGQSSYPGWSDTELWIAELRPADGKRSNISPPPYLTGQRCHTGHFSFKTAWKTTKLSNGRSRNRYGWILSQNCSCREDDS